jgi:predicted nucleic acid-binding protein
VKVVVNATPSIALFLINRLELLHQLFDRVIVPTAVYKEVAIQGANMPGATELASASWIEVQMPKTSPTIEPMLMGLDIGELQVLILAKEINPDWVIIDERLGRRVARVMGLPVKGTVGVLLAAYQSGYLSQIEVMEGAQQMVDRGIRISPKVINWLETQLDDS